MNETDSAQTLPSPQAPSSSGELRLARDGAGALLQRDYWAALQDCRLTPADLVLALRQRFCEFAPPELVVFERNEGCNQPLALGEELSIAIQMAGKCGVRVTSVEDHSFTLATRPGHPEAGRITFGSYRHESGNVVFHIRSRSRSGDPQRAAGFFMIGEAMQTDTWVEFVRTVANTFGTGVVGEVHAETIEVELHADDDDSTRPTFIARGED